MWLQNRSCHGGRACIWPNVTCSPWHTFVVLALKAGALSVVGKLSTSELHLQLLFVSSLVVHRRARPCVCRSVRMSAHIHVGTTSDGLLRHHLPGDCQADQRTGQQATGTCLSLWSACLCSISIGTAGMHHRTCGVVFCCLVWHGFWGLNWGPRALRSKHLIDWSLSPASVRF